MPNDDFTDSDLGWFRRSTHKRNTTRAISDVDEKKGSKALGLKQRKNSGAGMLKGDIFSSQCLGECKTTGADQITIQRKDVEKIITLGLRSGKIPFLRFSFRGGELAFVILSEREFSVLLGGQ